jgi:hypothetical protein
MKPADSDHAGPGGRLGRPRLGQNGGRTLGIIGLLLLVQAALVAAFVLPAHKPEPHNIPLGVVGPPPLAKAIEGHAPGVFDVTTFASEPAARRAIEHRQVYGALAVDGDERHLLITSAASARSPSSSARRSRSTTGGSRSPDLKPLTAEDPRGATINLLF